MLKDAALVLAKPLTFIINLSLETAVVPNEWKVSKVIPLYKCGSLAKIYNYRPISILPTVSKILLKIVHKQLMAHMEHHSLLFKNQFGFRPNRSTELAVTYFTDFIRKEADNGKATGAVFIDLSKAFDTISHSVLLSKLSRYGVYDMELQWFTDYLYLRKQMVQFNGVFSEPNPISELIFNLKKGKSEVMLFDTGKRLNLLQGCHVKLSVNDSPINTTTCPANA